MFSYEIFEFLFFDFAGLCLPPYVLHCFRPQPRKLSTVSTGIEVVSIALGNGSGGKFCPLASR